MCFGDRHETGTEAIGTIEYSEDAVEYRKVEVAGAAADANSAGTGTGTGMGTRQVGVQWQEGMIAEAIRQVDAGQVSERAGVCCAAGGIAHIA